MALIEFGAASGTQPLFPISTTAKIHGIDDVAACRTGSANTNR